MANISRLCTEHDQISRLRTEYDQHQQVLYRVLYDQNKAGCRVHDQNKHVLYRVCTEYTTEIHRFCTEYDQNRQVSYIDLAEFPRVYTKHSIFD